MKFTGKKYYIYLKTPDCVDIKLTYHAQNPKLAVQKAIAYCSKNVTGIPWYFKPNTKIRVKEAYTPRHSEIYFYTLTELGISI